MGERIPFFLLHSLTNQENDHEQIFCFVTAFRSNFNGLVRIRNSVCTCLDGFKAGSELVRFPTGVLCFGRHVFSSGSFGCSRVET